MVGDIKDIPKNVSNSLCFVVPTNVGVRENQKPDTFPT
jgi:hypothetical protein